MSYRRSRDEESLELCQGSRRRRGQLSDQKKLLARRNSHDQERRHAAVFHQLAVAIDRHLARGSAAVHAALFAREARRPEEISTRFPNFKLGGKYDLANPKKWEFGGEGGTTLESLGAGKLTNGLHRHRYPAPQRGRRDHQCGGHQLLLFRRLHRYVRAVGRGYGAVRWCSHHRFRAVRSIRIATMSSWSIPSGRGAPASRRTSSGQSFRSTAITTWCRPTTACCATISKCRMSHWPPAFPWAARRPTSGASCIRSTCRP